MGVGMGFHMKRISTTLRLTAVLLLLSLLSTSCMKKQNLKEEDLGPTISSFEVATALSEGFGVIDYNDIRREEEVGIAFTQALQGQSPQVIEQQNIIINRIDNDVNPNELVLNFDVEVTSGSDTIKATGVDKSYTKTEGFAFADDTNHPIIFMFEYLQNVALFACYNGGSYPETCHNLIVKDTLINLPPALASKHSHCAGQPSCSISGKLIEFDLVRHWQTESTSDSRPRRIHYSFLLSDQVPFTSRVLRYCTRALYEVSPGQPKVLADRCYTVNNYTFGRP